MRRPRGRDSWGRGQEIGGRGSGEGTTGGRR